MMKILSYLFILIIGTSAIAQNIERKIVLKDAETQLPIEDVTVLILKTKQILLSNKEGVVQFELNGNSSIQIAHTSYLGLNIRSTTLKEKENIIYLKSIVNDLDEIIITKQHPQKILTSLIQNSIKTLSVPGRLKIYCREFFKLNGKYSYYNDGLMNFQILGKTKKFDTNILVEQNRSYGIINDSVTSDLLGYNLNDIMENYYNFKYLNPLLQPNSKKQYDFIVKGYAKNKDYNLMSIIPSDEAKGLLDDFTIVYDFKKKIIIEVSSVISAATFSKNDKKTGVGSKNIYKSYFKTIYKVDNLNYYLVSSKEEIGFEKIEKNSKKNIEVRNYFVTTNFSNQNYSYTNSEVFKDKTLFNKKNVILTDYWNVSGLVATKEEQDIINRIAEEHK